MRKNIIVINDYGYIEGGAAKVAITSSIALAESSEYDVYFICGTGPVSQELRNSRIKQTYFFSDYDNLHNPHKIAGIFNGIKNKAYSKFLEDILQNFSNGNTLIHVHTWTKSCTSVVFQVCLKFGFKTIVTLHDYFWVCPNGGFFNYTNRAICELEPLSIRCMISNCDSRNYVFKIYRYIRQLEHNICVDKEKIFFIFISQFSRRILKRHMKEDESLYKRSFFLYDPVEFSTHRKRIDVQKNSKYLYVGRVSEEKGVRLFCEAIQNLNTDATVIGYGPLFDELKNKYKDIEFTGWLAHDKIEKFYENSRVLVFPSLWYETLGLTILEAQSYGIPVIVPDKCSGSELIENDVNGMIFNTGNLCSLLECLEKAKDDEFLFKLSENSYTNFSNDKWSMSSHIKGLANIYENIFKS